MGRRKKNLANGGKNKNNDEQKYFDGENIKFNIASDTKRSVAAVFLFALALVIVLGFLDKAGTAGRQLSRFSGLILGWAKLIFPMFLAITGIILLRRKETSFYVAKILGLSVTLLSFTTFFHWLFFSAGKMLEMAKAGQGGGYVGYSVAYLLTAYLGQAGSLVVIAAMFCIGIIVAFNFSFIRLWNNLKKKEIEEVVSEENKAPEEIEKEVSYKEEKIEKEEKTEKGKEDGGEDNIGYIEFVEGKDQYVSPALISGDLVGSGFSKKSLMQRKSLNAGGYTKGLRNNTWVFPPLDLLEKSSGVAKGGDVQKNAEIIEKTLKDFGIDVERGEIKTGPSVTQYSFRPAVGVKIAKILALQNDLALALAAHPIRIEAPIPGKSLIGIEVPNKVSSIVRLRGILEGSEFMARKSNLTLALGEDVSGNFTFDSLEKMPHLMIAGATGTGKSVCINSIITSLLYQNSPEDLKFIMVDPKRVELTLYNDIPHLLSGVIVENGKVINALRWAVGEMERRYRLLQDTTSRDLASYKEKQRGGKKKKCTNPETGEITEQDLENLPFIVIVIDELADLMSSHGKEVEGAVVRLAQMARAVGIHLIISTQRPSVEVITGLIKANITTRVAFQVATQIDSRTILDMGGAEKLLGNGDMLYLSASSPKPKRIQGIYVSESEVKRVVKFIKDQKMEEPIGEDITAGARKDNLLEFKNSNEEKNEDDLYEAAKEEVERAKKASASLLQRRLRVGYARAARLLDILEDRGIVGPADGAKPRDVYAVGNAKEADFEGIVEDQEKRDKWQI